MAGSPQFHRSVVGWLIPLKSGIVIFTFIYNYCKQNLEKGRVIEEAGGRGQGAGGKEENAPLPASINKAAIPKKSVKISRLLFPIPNSCTTVVSKQS